MFCQAVIFSTLAFAPCTPLPPLVFANISAVNVLKPVQQIKSFFFAGSAGSADFGGLLKLFPVVSAVVECGFNVFVSDAQAVADFGSFFREHAGPVGFGKIVVNGGPQSLVT